MAGELPTDEKARRLQVMLEQIAAGDGIESLVRRPGASLERAAAANNTGTGEVLESVQRLESGRRLTPDDVDHLEAIVLPDKRPVAYIRGGKYSDVPQTLWQRLNQPAVRERIQPLFPAIGRVEVPGGGMDDYFGTAFVVGQSLLMTNRHVGKAFADGVGTKRLRYHPDGAAVDFIREDGSKQSAAIRVTDVVMIHPYWDMALLKVESLPAGVVPLKLAVTDPEQHLDQDVLVVGYPARDDRSNLRVQDRIFDRKYGVKRLQPGKVRAREAIASFGNRVRAMTHDASTLGGNSGSAVIDVETGTVIGLHFAGVYLKANYAVPTVELARDPRVLDAGLNFVERVPTDAALTDGPWAIADGGEAPPAPPANPPAAGPAPASFTPPGAVTLTIPLHITISFGTPVMGTPPPPPPGPSPADDAAIEKKPVVFANLASRKGYRPDFLGLGDGETVPLPKLTAKGEDAVTRLLGDEDEYELRYHKFSIMMHRERRLALFTAANVDWREEKRRIDGKRPTRKQLNGFEGDTSETWVLDDRIPVDAQLPDVFYTKDDGSFDKGHLVRRDDVAYGTSFQDMQKSNGDTFHVTNCSPQTAAFNRPKTSKFNWGALEEMIREQTSAEKVCVFSGPVLDEGDRFFHGKTLKGKDVSVPIPSRFWKVVVANHDGKPAAYGFVLDQDLLNVRLHDELVVPDGWKRLIRPLSEIEGLLGGLAKLGAMKQWDRHGH